MTILELSKVIETVSLRCDSSLFDKVGEYTLSEKQLERGKLSYFIPRPATTG